MKKVKLIYGVGKNDADYAVRQSINGKSILCPFYSTWRRMIYRCYSQEFQEVRQTYKGCSVCDDWLLFSNFRSWMTQQNWFGLHLDKDILKIGNKIYSPDTCVFVPPTVNALLEASDATRGEYPIGVSFEERRSKYRAQISINGKNLSLGSFVNPQFAHQCWQNAKAEVIEKVAIEQTDIRIKTALMLRVVKLRDDIANGRETIKL